jgi:predicted double-glycine peptidase
LLRLGRIQPGGRGRGALPGHRRPTPAGSALGRLFLLVACALAVSACSTTGNPGWYDEQIEQGEVLAVPYVRQSSQADCGMAVLVSVMEYYKGPTYSQHVLLDRYPAASPRGYSLGELRDIARTHDFAGFVVPGDKTFLRKQLGRGRPLIVPLRIQENDSPLPGAPTLSTRLVGPLLNRVLDTSYDHYMVVVGMDDERRKVITIDPARGPVELDLDDFAASWERMNNAVLLIGLASEPD